MHCELATSIMTHEDGYIVLTTRLVSLYVTTTNFLLPGDFQTSSPTDGWVRLYVAKKVAEVNKISGCSEYAYSFTLHNNCCRTPSV